METERTRAGKWLLSAFKERWMFAVEELDWNAEEVAIKVGLSANTVRKVMGGWGVRFDKKWASKDRLTRAERFRKLIGEGWDWVEAACWAGITDRMAVWLLAGKDQPDIRPAVEFRDITMRHAAVTKTRGKEKGLESLPVTEAKLPDAS